MTDWQGRATTYSYDAASNLIKTLYPNGAGIAFNYDAANRLKQVLNSYRGSNDPPLNPVTSFTYALDAVGNRLQVTDGSGKVTKYGYDPLYQLTSVTVDDKVTRFAYDAVGNRLSLTAPGTSINYSYDAADRLLAADSSRRGEDTAFTYDPNGNQITKTANAVVLTYQYDAADRLTAVTGNGLNSAFAYDGDGNRVSQSVGAGTYTYVNDVATALPVVLQEAGPDGDISYAHGLGLASATSSSFDVFYHYDGLGSVAGLTEPSGKLAERYMYDAWGETVQAVPRPQLGTKNKFQFTGEALDPGTGLYYLRARYYDPTVGRFLVPDPAFGHVQAPRTLNRYPYALNNATNLIDPSGQSVQYASAVIEQLASEAATSLMQAVELRNKSGTVSFDALGAGYALSLSIQLYTYTDIGLSAFKSYREQREHGNGNVEAIAMAYIETAVRVGTALLSKAAASTPQTLLLIPAIVSLRIEFEKNPAGYVTGTIGGVDAVMSRIESGFQQGVQSAVNSVNGAMSRIEASFQNRLRRWLSGQ